MKLTLKNVFTAMLFAAGATTAAAQLSTNPDKFLGNITTTYQIDYGTEKFYELWNQITPENESKWDAVEGQRRGQFNFSATDRIYNYARQHKFPFKWHTLVWGSQYPTWMNSLSKDEQLKAIEEWMDAVKKRYPDLPMIDVVNEAVAGHAPAPYKDALGGDGRTGYDWIIRAFEMAHERWPNAILIYNDYNTFQWNTDQFISLVQTLRDAGAPIDAYGCQSHDLTGCEASTLRNSMTKIQNALKMPMYITEYDIGTADDQLQLKNFSEQLPLLWEADYCAGVTLWGYIYGKTWTTNGNSGLIRDGKDRPAMTWLRQYMKTDKAKQAKSPFPGMQKEASVYVRPSALKVTKGQPISIEVRAAMRTKTIDHVDLYVNSKLQQTMTEAPYMASYTPAGKGRYNLRAVVTNTDGTTYERHSAITAFDERRAHKGPHTLPGTLEAEDFDQGGEGYTFHDSDSKNEGTTAYRTDGEGVDMVTCSGGYAIGYTATGEWLEYTVDVAEEGYYNYEVRAACGSGDGSAITIRLADDDCSDVLAQVTIPQTDNGTWGTYKALTGITRVPLSAGKHVLRVTIDKPYVNLDKVVFTHTDEDPDCQQFTDLAQLAATAQPFAICGIADDKAFYGSGNQNLGYADYATAFGTGVVGYYFKLESLATAADASLHGCYLLRLLTTGGEEYSIWGSPGYLNSQPANQSCSFILGLNNQYGQDMKNGAVWDIKYVDGRGYTLRNVSTGKYLHDNGPARYDDPAYFRFCTTKYALGIEVLPTVATPADDALYDLNGRRVDSSHPRPGLYLRHGRKVIIR